MKNFLTLIMMICFVSFLNAQEEKTTFLTKMEVKWMDAEIGELQSTYQIIKRAVAQKDGVEVSRNKTEIIKSVTTLTSNSKIFYTKITMDIDKDEIAKSRMTDTPDDYYVNKRKNDPRSQELSISEEKVAEFKKALDTMDKIKNELKASQFALHPQQQQTHENLKSIAKFIKLANANNQIIQNSVRT